MPDTIVTANVVDPLALSIATSTIESLTAMLRTWTINHRHAYNQERAYVSLISARGKQTIETGTGKTGFYPSCIGIVSESKSGYFYKSVEILSRYVVKDSAGKEISYDTLKAIGNRFDSLFGDTGEKQVKQSEVKKLSALEVKAMFYSAKPVAESVKPETVKPAASVKPVVSRKDAPKAKK
jgi:hypothetical protein